MTTLTATRGLPASGKSTWARSVQAEHPETVLVSKDDLRAMLHGGRWSKGNEKQVISLRDEIVKDALARGRDVIVHDTNFHQPHIDALKALAKAHSVHFELKDFSDVPLDVCLARDAQRPNGVGQQVIRRMWRQYLRTAVAPPEYVEGKPDVIICDLDGTLAIMCDRSPYDTTGLCINDTLNPVVYRLLWMESEAGTGIILMSGREEIVRTATLAWVAKHGIEASELFMRPTGDKRKDSVVKRELYERHIAGRYNVRYVLDDRPQVVRMWREELGLFVLDVNQTGEDF